MVTLCSVYIERSGDQIKVTNPKLFIPVTVFLLPRVVTSENKQQNKEMFWNLKDGSCTSEGFIHILGQMIHHHLRHTAILN